MRRAATPKKWDRFCHVALAFSAQAAGCQLEKFLINQRSEFFKGLLVALPPLNQQSSHVVGGRHGLHVENTELQPWWHCIPVCRPDELGFIAPYEKFRCMIDFGCSLRMSR